MSAVMIMIISWLMDDSKLPPTWWANRTEEKWRRISLTDSTTYVTSYGHF